MAAPLYEIVAGDIVQVTWWQTYQGSRILNVHHYRAQPTSPVTDGNNAMTDLLDDLESKFVGGAPGTTWQDLTVESWLMDWLTVQVIYPTRRYYRTKPLGLAGLLADPGAPSNTAAVLNFSSNRPERGSSGSKHFAGFPLSRLDGAFWNLTATTALQTFGGLFLDQVAITTGGNWEPIIWSPTTAATDNWPVDVTAYSSVRIMRRRTVGVGE